VKLGSIFAQQKGVELVIGSPEPVMDPPVFTIVDAAERRRGISQSSRRPASGAASPKTDEKQKKPSIELVLYVSSVSAHSTAAIRNLRQALSKYAGQAVKLTVHDLSKDPQRAERDGVHFTPSLVTAGLGPKTWIVGHLGNPQILQALIESTLEPPE
jgi:hypothetical protein